MLLEVVEMDSPTLNGVPHGWTIAPFSALAEYVNGRAFKPEDWGTDGLPIIRIAQITNPEAETNFYSGYVDPRNLIDKDDLIFSWSATLAVMRWQKGPAVLNQHLFKVTPAEGIDRDWLQFRLEASIPDLADEAHGTTMKHIRKGTLSTQTTVVPPLDEQRRIAEVLRSLDETIAAQSRAVSQARRALLGLQASLLDPTVNQRNWKTVKIGEIARLFAGGTPRRDKPEYYGGGIPWLKSGEVRQNRIRFTEETISRKAVAETAARIVAAGTPVVAMYGATAGVVGMLEIEAAINQAVLAVEPIPAKATARYLVHALQQATTRMLLSLQGSGQPNLSKSLVAQVEILLPDIHEQEATAKLLDGVVDQVVGGQRTIAANKALKRELAADLLSGRVRVPS